MRLALAQINPTVGDLEGNRALVLDRWPSLNGGAARRASMARRARRSIFGGCRPG